MTHPALRRSLLALSILLLSAGAAQAGSGLYLDIKSAPGESTDLGHEGQIDVGSLSWGASVAIGSRLGGGGAGKPSVQDIAWTQGPDASIVPLFSNATSGHIEPIARFDVVKPNTKGNDPYLSLTAEKAVIDSLQFGGSNGGGFGVSGAMAFEAVTLSYDSRPLGKADPVQATRYDLLKNTTTGPAGRKPTAVTGNAPAQPGLFLRLGNGATSIAGDSRAIGYENWIPIDSFSMGTSLAYSLDGQVTSKPSVSALSWSQQLDATAPAVLFDLLSGKSIAQATIEQVRLGRNGLPVTVMQLALNDVLFSSFSLSTGGSGDVGFAGSMDFASYTQAVWPLLADGSRGKPTSFGYDVLAAKAIPGKLASDVAGFGNGNLDPSALPVPEPQTWAMMLAGITGLLAVARRRRAAA